MKLLEKDIKQPKAKDLFAEKAAQMMKRVNKFNLEYDYSSKTKNYKYFIQLKVTGESQGI
jgi:hypothetical protein